MTNKDKYNPKKFHGDRDRRRGDAMHGAIPHTRDALAYAAVLQILG